MKIYDLMQEIDRVNMASGLCLLAMNRDKKDPLIDFMKGGGDIFGDFLGYLYRIRNVENLSKKEQTIVSEDIVKIMKRIQPYLKKYKAKVELGEIKFESEKLKTNWIKRAAEFLNE